MSNHHISYKSLPFRNSCSWSTAPKGRCSAWELTGPGWARCWHAVPLFSPLHPPTRFYFSIGFPCYLLSFLFFKSIVSLVSSSPSESFLIFSNIHRHLCLCAAFLVRIAVGGAAPSPLHPPMRFYFLIGFPCYLLHFFFFTSIVYLCFFKYNQYLHSCCYCYYYYCYYCYDYD